MTHPAPLIHFFPGQGDFSLSSLHRATAVSPELEDSLREVFSTLDALCVRSGLPALGDVLLERGRLRGRDVARMPAGAAQLGLFGVSLGVHRALCRLGMAPTATLGVSFGEIAALCASGVLSVADGGRAAMSLAPFLSPAGGLSLLAESASRVREMLGTVSGHEVVIAIENTPSETVVAGPLAGLLAVEALARRHQVPFSRLPLPFLVHHPAVRREADAYAETLRALSFGRPRIPMFSAVAERWYGAEEDFPSVMSDCLVRPLNLPAVVPQVAKDAVWVEAGTGGALAQTLRTILPDAAVWSPVAEPGFSWVDGRAGGGAGSAE